MVGEEEEIKVTAVVQPLHKEILEVRTGEQRDGGDDEEDQPVAAAKRKHEDHDKLGDRSNFAKRTRHSRDDVRKDILSHNHGVEGAEEEEGGVFKSAKDKLPKRQKMSNFARRRLKLKRLQQQRNKGKRYVRLGQEEGDNRTRDTEEASQGSRTADRSLSTNSVQNGKRSHISDKDDRLPRRDKSQDGQRSESKRSESRRSESQRSELRRSETRRRSDKKSKSRDNWKLQEIESGEALCKLCGYGWNLPDELELGPLYRFGVCQAHLHCLIFSSGLVQVTLS